MDLYINKFQELIKTPQNIVVLTHHNPDGDAVGSVTAISHYLINKGHIVTPIVPNEIPAYLKKVNGIDIIHDYSKEYEVLDRVIREATLFICVDFNEITVRIGQAIAESVMSNLDAKRVVIDHHLMPNIDLYDVAFCDSDAPATCYIIAKLIEQMGDMPEITPVIAEAIYLGIMTDTGSFSYANLSSDLFRIVSLIVDKGASPVEINNKVSNVQSITRMRLIGYGLYEKMKVIKHRRMAYITLSETELMNFNYRSGDTEGLVNLPLSIEGVELSALFIENRECIKISLRSQGKNAVDVNSFAREYFSGGGHKMAAGAKSFNTMEKTVEIFINGVDKLYR